MIDKLKRYIRLALSVTGSLMLILGGCATPPANTVEAPQAAKISPTATPELQQEGIRAVSAFEKWMAEHRVRSGSIAISYQGSEVIQKGIRRDPAEAYPVASLSKAITAICLQEILDDRDQKMSMTLAQVTPELLKRSPPADSRFANITLAQLVSHNSGIHSRYHRDFIAERGRFNNPYMREQFKVLAAEKLAADAGSGFHYSNANYLLLGLAIEELSGGEYEQICREQVLLPINVTARLNERWKVMSSWGG